MSSYMYIVQCIMDEFEETNWVYYKPADMRKWLRCIHYPWKFFDIELILSLAYCTHLFLAAQISGPIVMLYKPIHYLKLQSTFQT